MKKILFTIIIALSFSMVKAQTNVIQDGNKLTLLHPTSSVQDTSITRNSVLTSLVFTAADEIVYPVWQSDYGAYYVVRVSKKSGNQYRQYLKITN